MKLIYLASPYTYKSKIPFVSWAVRLYRYRLITKIAGLLHEQYPNCAFILPITMSHHTIKYMKDKCSGWETWGKRDLFYISKCDEVWIVMMNGWRKSKGVNAESRRASKLNLPIKYINPYYV